MMLYVMSSIKNNGNMGQVKGSENLIFLLNVALVVSRIFAVIFLFYTNSFLMKRRKKEIGLYNILGMEKRHIAKMLTYETIIIAVISITAGMLSGILFGKLLFLALLKLISFKVVLGFDIPVAAVTSTLILFLGIFIVTLLYNLAKVHLTKPIELLHGGEIGEKEPKTKIILTLIGIGSMGWGYWFALTVESPFAAFTLFFAAVILVVIGTYCLFTAGSIAVLKILRKNKRYYYRTKNFTNVSGMLYRMKQNAVGLANICILSTMVLIMSSTTAALYMGMEDTLHAACPREISVQYETDENDKTAEIDSKVADITKANSVTASNYASYHYVSLICGFDGHKFNVKSDTINNFSAKGIAASVIVSLEEFNKINNSSYSLNDNEVIMYSKKSLKNINDISIETSSETQNFKVTKKLESVPDLFHGTYENIIDSYIIVVKDMDALKRIYTESSADIETGIPMYYSVQFDTTLGKDESMKFAKTLDDNFDVSGVDYRSPDNIYEQRTTYFGMYGGFLFIGVFLSILFVMATVLIIYYKQISEGYEDKTRFEIMQKVGMSHAEIKKTIRSQVLFVFFLPIIVTAIHIAVSFRIIEKMLLLLGLANSSLFIGCTIVIMLIFCLVYGIVFAITAKSYYKIVSNGNDK